MARRLAAAPGHPERTERKWPGRPREAPTRTPRRHRPSLRAAGPSQTDDPGCRQDTNYGRDVSDLDDDPEARRGTLSWPQIPVRAGADGPGCAGLPAWLRPKTGGRIRLGVPWRTLAGLGPEPGELSWTGPITPAQARQLAAAAAADPNVTWRLIVTDDDGHAITVTTLRTRRGTAPAARAWSARSPSPFSGPWPLPSLPPGESGTRSPGHWRTSMRRTLIELREAGRAAGRRDTGGERGCRRGGR